MASTTFETRNKQDKLLKQYDRSNLVYTPGSQLALKSEVLTIYLLVNKRTARRWACGEVRLSSLKTLNDRNLRVRNV